jgi:hypothetical protein
MGFLDKLLGREKKPAEAAPAATMSEPSGHAHDQDEHDHGEHDHSHDEGGDEETADA